MKSMPFHFAGYLKWLLMTLLGGVLIAIGFVMLVDPYGLYGIVKQEGFNSVKPGLTRYQDEIKLTHAIAMRAGTVILGNSRAEIGLDPDALAFAKSRNAIYNLAIPGIVIDTSRRQLEYLHDAGIKLNTVIVGLEFLDAILPVNKNSLLLPGMPRTDEPHRAHGYFWRFDSLFSLTSVKDAVRTLRIQQDNEAVTISAKGFNPLKEYQAFVRNDGYELIFRQRAQENAGTYVKRAANPLGPADFRNLRAILELAAKEDTELKLIIYPYHAQILVMFEEAGLWSTFEEWKKQLIAEVSRARTLYPAARITLLDFSGFGTYQCERIPSRNDRKAATRWYWEAGHFKKELGDIVLTQTMAPASTVPDSAISALNTQSVFGMPLDESSLILNRKRIAAERSACANAYPELFSEARAMVAKARNDGK